jgi:predicted PurR-regulated permease PerM
MLGGAMISTQRSAVTLFNTARTVALSLTRGIFGLVMTLMISAYILMTTDRIFEFFRTLYRPSRRPDFDDLVRRLDRGLAGVVRGQLIICCVNGALSGIGFALLGLKYWTFLTLVAMAMSIVPIFGSILSTVPAVIVALPQGVGLALLVLAWVVAIHQLEANFLNPKIMGDSARVHPVLVVFALLMGEHVAGLVGALLAVPVLSITQTLFFHLRERFLGVPRPFSTPPSQRPSLASPQPTAAAPKATGPLHDSGG